MTSKGKWYGKPIEEHTKEELIDIIIWLCKDAKRTLEKSIKDRKVFDTERKTDDWYDDCFYATVCIVIALLLTAIFVLTLTA